jgi:hypothetical protein
MLAKGRTAIDLSSVVIPAGPDRVDRSPGQRKTAATMRITAATATPAINQVLVRGAGGTLVT